MVMRIGILGTLLFSVSIILTGTLHAGTLSMGGRSFYAQWDSGMARMTAAAVEAQLKREMEAGVAGLGEFSNYSNLEVGDPEGRGFIFGPVLGYQTDDRKWDATLSLMWFGSYTTSIDSGVDVTGDFPFVGSVTQRLGITTKLDIEHRDIDLQVGYMLTDLLRAFAGYRYQSYETAIRADYAFTFASQSAYANLDFEMKAVMHMPYAGAGIVLDVSDNLTAKVNAALGLVVGGSIDQKLAMQSPYFNQEYRFTGGKVEMAYCLMGNASIAYKIMQRVNIELGYQYQRFAIKLSDVDLNADGQADESGSETDVFHGLTLGATVLFSL